MAGRVAAYRAEGYRRFQLKVGGEAEVVASEEPPLAIVETIPPAPDWLVNEPGAMLRADGSVWMRMGASTHWRPGHPGTLEEAQKFDPPVRIWPRRE